MPKDKKNKAKDKSKKPAIFSAEDLFKTFIRVRDITGKPINASLQSLLATDAGQKEIVAFFIKRLLVACGVPNNNKLTVESTVTMCRVLEHMTGKLVKVKPEEGTMAAQPVPETAKVDEKAKK